MGFFTKAVNAATISNQTFTSYSAFNNVAFGNGFFIANDSNKQYLYKFTDGISWSVISSDAPKFASLVFSNGTFVAIDCNINITSIDYNGINYIMAGTNTFTSKGVIYKSQDSTSWSNISVDIPTINYLGSGNGCFLAAASGGKLVYSIDGGTTWQTDTFTSTFNYNGMIYANNHFNVVGDNFSKMQVALSNPPTVTTVAAVAAAGNGKVDLTWTTVSGAISYKVYQRTATGTYGTSPVATVSEASTSIAGLTNGIAYYFVVKASNEEGDSVNSNEASEVPSLPKSTVATVTSGSCTVSTGGTGNETITNVPYGTTKADFQTVLIKGQADQTWDVTGLNDPVIT